MECPESASPYCDVRRFDDRCPTSNLAFYQCCEWLLASALFARNVAAEVGEALAYVLVIECLVECIRERVENWLRYALRRKQCPPRQRLKFRQAGLYCSWDIW
jgi:predicted Rdx family selenoprotein